MSREAVNFVLLRGAIMLTYVPPAEGTALLTVRGKDHDLTVDDMRALAAHLVEVADWVEGVTT